MKCPFKKRTTTYTTEQTEYFCDCDDSKCMAWVPTGPYDGYCALIRKQDTKIVQMTLNKERGIDD